MRHLATQNDKIRQADTLIPLLGVKDLHKKLRDFYESKSFLLFIILLGIILRLSQYLFNRSLWLDEAYLSLNIINKSFSELFQPLDYWQRAPTGFLLLEKTLVELFGSSEYVLRLLPLICGIVSLILFYKVAERYIQGKSLPIALAFFAISGSLIYYSAEVKQYSIDVAVALLLYLITLHVQEIEFKTWRTVLYAIICALSIWFSFAAVFVLVGIGLTITLTYVARKQWHLVTRSSIICLIWSLSIVGFYFLSVANADNIDVVKYWSEEKNSFMPFPPLSPSELKWFFDTFIAIFKNPLNFSLPGLAAFTFILGVITKYINKKGDVFILLLPVIIALLTSGLRMYPFSGRLLLFTVPVFLIFIAEGISQISGLKLKGLSAIWIILVLLAFNPFFSACSHLKNPRTREEIKPVLSHVREHWQEGDLIYLFHGSWPAFAYYSSRYGFEQVDHIEGVYTTERKNWSKFLEDMQELSNYERVWVLSRGHRREDLLLYYLNRLGIEHHSFKAPDATVYLYLVRKETFAKYPHFRNDPPPQLNFLSK